MRVTDDPAWQPPVDPLSQVNVLQQAHLVHREIPNTVVATGWTVPAARAAMNEMVVGLFDGAAQLADNIMRSDSRVQAAMASRLSILGRPVDFRLPRGLRDSALAKECRDAFIDAWPTMSTESVMSELQRWAIMMGFGIAQTLWDFSGEYAIPHLLPWHPRFVYYHWVYRCYIAITMDGTEAIVPGDASWVVHAPHGEYRGWMRGAVSAVTPWWLARHFALRDWARWSERHGLPMILAKTPAVGDPRQQAIFRNSLAGLGQETVLHLPQNPAPQLSYLVELLEAKDQGWEGFSRLISQCDVEITLAILAQNLTSEVKEGSFAAARVHADVRQALLESDARALAATLYAQLARPFAAINFGNADLAPRVIWDVTPYEDAQTKALSLQQIATAINAFRQAGVRPKDLRRLVSDIIPGLDIGELEDVEPLQVEAKKAAAEEGALRSTPDQRARGQRIEEARYRFDPHYGGSPRTRIAYFSDMGEEVREALAMREADLIRRGVERQRRAA